MVAMPVARTTDMGVGTSVKSGIPVPMVGQILALHAFTHLSEMLTVAVATDMVVGGDQSVGVIITFSATNMSTLLGKARMTDQFAGTFTGTIVTGSGTHMSG